MLSEFFDPRSAQAAAMVTLEGAAGGIGAHFLGKILPATISAQNKGIIQVGAGFVTAAMLKRPILGAGMAKANENATKVEKLMAYTDGYQQLALNALIAGVVLIAISPIVKKLMQEVK
jgi:POT family proton-dependent oligopeptide transporter